MDKADMLKSFNLSHVPHPGETVVEYLESFNWSQGELARRTGLTPKTISEICNSKAPITPSTALAFEKVLQRPAHLWLNLQRQYDEAEARSKAQARSKEWSGWARQFPIAAMRKCGFLASAPGQSDVEALLTYLGVSSPDSWKAVCEATPVAYRQTLKFKVSPEAISVWIRETEIEAAKIQTEPYNERLLRASIPALRALTLKRADSVMDPLREICARAGVAVVLVPELPQTGISGCARFLSSEKAVLALTLRYKTDDQMWFTFFHELGHLILHRKVRGFILDNSQGDVFDGDVDPNMQRYEEEAHRFAADTLIPPDALHQFLCKNPVIDNEALKAFSDSIGITPGIVVGRLQKDGYLKHHQGNAFKQYLGTHMKESPDEHL